MREPDPFTKSRSDFLGDSATVPQPGRASINTRYPGLSLSLAGLGIILVVFGHSDPVPPSEMALLVAKDPAYDVFHLLVRWVYTFHMPLFFFLAGANYVAFTAPKKRCYVDLVRSKVTRLLVPYLLITIVAFPVKAALSHFALRPEPLTAQAFLDGLLVPWHNPVLFLWFLPTLFLIFCVAPFLERSWSLRGGEAAMGSLAVAFYFLFPSRAENSLRWLDLAGALHFAVFFWAGMLFQHRKWEERAVAALVGAWAASLTVFFFVENVPPWGGLILSLLGIAGALGFSCMEKARPAVWLWIGTYSFQIYLFSWFPQIACRTGLGQVLHLPVWLVASAMFGSGLLAPILGTWMFNRSLPSRWHFLYGK